MKSLWQFDHDRYKFYPCKLCGLLKLFFRSFLARSQNSAFSSKWGLKGKQISKSWSLTGHVEAGWWLPDFSYKRGTCLNSAKLITERINQNVVGKFALSTIKTPYKKISYYTADDLRKCSGSRQRVYLTTVEGWGDFIVFCPSYPTKYNQAPYSCTHNWHIIHTESENSEKFKSSNHIFRKEVSYERSFETATPFRMLRGFSGSSNIFFLRAVTTILSSSLLFLVLYAANIVVEGIRLLQSLGLIQIRKFTITGRCSPVSHFNHSLNDSWRGCSPTRCSERLLTAIHFPLQYQNSSSFRFALLQRLHFLESSLNRLFCLDLCFLVLCLCDAKLSSGDGSIR